MNRREFISAGTVTASSLTAGCGGGIDSPDGVSLTAAESGSEKTALAIARVVSSLFDVTAYGARRDGVDSTAAIQAAFNAAAPAQGTVYFPRGNFRWSSPITVGDSVSIVGDGYASQLYAAGCAGFVLGVSNIIGARRISDFYMLGDGSSPAFAINTVVPPGSGRTTGLLFENLDIDSFSIAFDCKKLWHSTFLHVITNRCPRGLSFAGQCISNVLMGCRIQRGLPTPQVDGSIGVYVGPADGARPEDLKIVDATLVYGFDTNVYVESCLNFAVTGSDLDNAGTRALQCTIVDGGCSIVDNWLAVWGGGPGGHAIVFAPLAQPNASPIWIERNHLSCVAASANSAGIRIGPNHVGLKKIGSNQVVGFETSLVLDTVQEAVVESNYFQGANSVVTWNGSGHTFRTNQFFGAFQRVGLNGRDTFDHNGGSVTTCFHGPVVVPLYVTTVTYPLASLGVTGGNIQTGPGAYFQPKLQAYQFTGTVHRGRVRAYYEWSSNSVVIVWDTPAGNASDDIWLDLEVF